MKQKNRIMFGILFVMVLSIIGATSVSAHGDDVQVSLNNDGMMHNFDSGYEYGQHVRMHNKMFSGDMNPGVHHRGYSTFVR